MRPERMVCMCFIELHVVINITFEIILPLMITVSLVIEIIRKRKKRTKDKATNYGREHTKDK